MDDKIPWRANGEAKRILGFRFGSRKSIREEIKMGWENTSQAVTESSSDQNSIDAAEIWSPYDEIAKRTSPVSAPQEVRAGVGTQLQRVEFEGERANQDRVNQRLIPGFDQMMEQARREADPRRYYAQSGQNDNYRQPPNGPFLNGTGHLLSDQMGRPPRGGDRRFQEHPPQWNARDQRMSQREAREHRLQQQRNLREQQPAERKGLFGGKPLFGAREADKNEQANMNKIEFNARDERGVVKELWLPNGFRADAENDQAQRLYTRDDTESRVAIYGGRDLSDEESKSLQSVLSQKPGLIAENSPAYDAAVSLMGGGYHSFLNKPEVSTVTVNGKNVILLTDSDPEQGLQGYTMFVPSDKQQFLYAVSFDGTQKDFSELKPGLDKIQWRRTPDAVEPPKPFLKR